MNRRRMGSSIIVVVVIVVVIIVVVIIVVVVVMTEPVLFRLLLLFTFELSKSLFIQPTGCEYNCFFVTSIIVMMIIPQPVPILHNHLSNG
jgi:hypothetical protein